MNRLLSACLLFMVIGCAPSKPFVNAVSQLWSAIGPEYRTYVSGDATLSEDGKATRLRSADMMDALLREAKGGDDG